MNGINESTKYPISKTGYQQVMLVVSLLLVSFSSVATIVSPVVSPDWLIKNLNQPDLAIIEVSDKVEFSFNGHIPGSVVTNKSAWRFVDTDGSLVRLPIDVLEDNIRKLGINHPASHFKGLTRFHANPRYGRIPGSFNQPMMRR